MAGPSEVKIDFFQIDFVLAAGLSLTPHTRGLRGGGGGGSDSEATSQR